MEIKRTRYLKEIIDENHTGMRKKTKKSKWNRKTNRNIKISENVYNCVGENQEFVGHPKYSGYLDYKIDHAGIIVQYLRSILFQF